MDYGPRLRRAAMVFVVGFLVVLPISAMAAPAAFDAGTAVAFDAPGRSGDAPGQSGDAPGRSGDAPGQSGDAPSATAPAVRPERHGPPPHVRDIGAAFVMLELPDDVEVAAIVTPAEPGGLSGGVVSVLSPVLPPALVDAVAAPIVIFEALVEAMLSSGQALVIPLLAAGAGFFAPGLRRRDIVAAVVEAD